jgi:hypothetical protein
VRVTTLLLLLVQQRVAYKYPTESVFNIQPRCTQPTAHVVGTVWPKFVMTRY